MSKSRESGFIDRVVVAVVGMSIGAALAMAAESGMKPAPVQLSDVESFVYPQGYAVPAGAPGPFVDNYLYY